MASELKSAAIKKHARSVSSSPGKHRQCEASESPSEYPKQSCHASKLPPELHEHIAKYLLSDYEDYVEGTLIASGAGASVSTVSLEQEIPSMFLPFNTSAYVRKYIYENNVVEIQPTGYPDKSFNTHGANPDVTYDCWSDRSALFPSVKHCDSRDVVHKVRFTGEMFSGDWTHLASMSTIGKNQFPNLKKLEITFSSLGWKPQQRSLPVRALSQLAQTMRQNPLKFNADKLEIRFRMFGKFGPKPDLAGDRTIQDALIEVRDALWESVSLDVDEMVTQDRWDCKDDSISDAGMILKLN